jgi:1-aminocyclopropane-1-carboxylate deaminase/D-cysteine desulfhydrase-like pyridoxal-dependent ACC family enzyme
MADAANGAAELLGVPHRLTPADIHYTGAQIGADYGRLTPASRAALRLMAATEALLLDPVYTARAAAELIADVRSGRVPAGSSVVFVHTGGTPAVFAAAGDVLGDSA